MCWEHAPAGMAVDSSVRGGVDAPEGRFSDNAETWLWFTLKTVAVEEAESTKAAAISLISCRYSSCPLVPYAETPSLQTTAAQCLESHANGRRARTEQEQQALGWKSKRQVRIEVLKAALTTAWDGIEEEFSRLKEQAEIRGAKIYFDTLNQALKDGKDKRVAENLANNAMTRAGLRRMDGQAIGLQGLNKRDREIRVMEDAILQRAESEMDDDEREQLELLREHEKAVLENSKKRGR